MYFVIPRFIIKGKYVLAIISVLAIFILTALLSAVISTQILPEIRGFVFGKRYSHDFSIFTNTSFFLSLLAGLRGGITIGGLAAAIKLMKYWYVKEQRNLQLQKEKAEANLQLLKAQVHPHFLFNTLNNIYSFTQNTSPEASAMLTKLSLLLRFIIYEGSHSMVPLQKELKMLQDYIDLEKIRYGNQMDLHIDLPADTEGYYIAPLLLLPLIENSFKHGTSQMLEQPWIHLYANVENDQLYFKLLNGKIREEDRAIRSKGIGIKNVRERLMLLYPGKHELTITNEEEVFIVNLKIRLEIKKYSIKQRAEEPEHV